MVTGGNPGGTDHGNSRQPLFNMAFVEKTSQSSTMNGSQLQHKVQAIELVTEQLSLGYAQQLVIKGLDLRFPAQQVTAIIGPNGCGKSTLLSEIGRASCRERVTISGWEGGAT